MAFNNGFEVPMEEHQFIELNQYKELFKILLKEYQSRFPHFKLFYAGLNTHVPSENQQYSYCLIFLGVNEYGKKIAVVDTVPFFSPRSITGFRYALKCDKANGNKMMTNKFFDSFVKESFQILYTTLIDFMKFELTTDISFNENDVVGRDIHDVVDVISKIDKHHLNFDKDSPYYFGKEKYVNNVAGSLHDLRNMYKPKADRV